MAKYVTTPGPCEDRVSLLGPSTSIRIAMPFKFKTMSVTSSLTPETDENSCSTLSIWIPVIALRNSDIYVAEPQEISMSLKKIFGVN